MDFKSLKKELPNGALKDIATLSKVSYNTVHRFFNGSNTRCDVEIIEATLTYFKEKKEKKDEAIKQLKTFLNS